MEPAAQTETTLMTVPQPSPAQPSQENFPQEPAPTPPPQHKSRMPLIILGAIIAILIFFVGGILFIMQSYKPVVTQTKAETPTVDAVKSKGKIVVGTDATFPPMEFKNDQGEYTGYDVDLIRRIAEKLEVQVEFKDILFDNFIDELKAGNVDIVISSVSITDERKKEVLFSDPYLYAGQVIITRKDEKSISTTDDLKGKKIAVQKGTTNEQQAREFTDEENVLLYDDYSQATAALLDGSADAIFSDLTGAKGIIDANPLLRVASEPFTQESYGIVFAQNKDDLAQEVNSIVNSLRQQGVLTFLKQKWLD